MTIENNYSQELEPTPEVFFGCLVEDEINRVKYLCSKRDWYKENRYQPTYPKTIQDKFDKGEDITEEDIEKSVTEEFDSSSNEKEISEVKVEWNAIKDEFFKNLKTLGLPIQEKYFLSLTKYGTGGSYGVPNHIQLNIGQMNRAPSFTIAHEIVHLTIEHLIKEYKIDHWTKERIVDLIMNKFFPDDKKLQRSPENAEKINEIFDSEFPDIQKLVKEISELKPETISDKVERIKDLVLNTFPFVSKEQEALFLEKFNVILKDDEDYSDLDLLVRHIRVALASLENSHTVLRGREGMFGLEKKIFYKAHKFWIDDNGIISEIIGINSVPIEEIIKEKRKEIGGGTEEWQIEMALGSLRSSTAPSASIFELKNGEEIEVKYVERKQVLDTERIKSLVSAQVLESGIGYLRVSGWYNYKSTEGKDVGDIAEEKLAELYGCDSIIIDVRDNTGGNSSFAEKVAGHFVREKTSYAKILRRQEENYELVSSEAFIEPRGGFFDKKIVLLIGPKCLSSNEMFILMLKDAGRAITVGQITGGGSGNPISTEIKIGDKEYLLNVSRWMLQRKSGDFLEGKGIEPDIFVETTDDDITKKLDVELKKAIEYLREKDNKV